MLQLEPTYLLSQKRLIALSIQPEAHFVPQQTQTGSQLEPIYPLSQAY